MTEHTAAVCVVIPAANEGRNIGLCLDAVAVAREIFYRRAKTSVRVYAVVVLDRCVDSTGPIARSYAGWVDVVGSEAGNVGIARALGCARALSAAQPAQHMWLANTDADSRVPPDWICRMVDEAADGTHIVLGTVALDERASAECRRIWQARHSVSEGHPHVHGANFGIRGDVYLRLGGWPPLESGEDVELARRASSVSSLRITRTAQIPVVTSTRSFGRAPNGFASYLRDLEVSDRRSSSPRRTLSP